MSSPDSSTTATTRLGHFAVRLAESAWLGAALTVPLLYNLRSLRIFSPDKAYALRSLAIVAAAACLIAATQGSAYRRFRQPLVLPALGLFLAMTLATALSIAPTLSFWGADHRGQGLITSAAGLCLFLALAAHAGHEEVERLLRCVAIAGTAVAAHAIGQFFGLDPVRWTAGHAARLHGTMGNPIFLGAFLVFTIPVTAAFVALPHGPRVLYALAGTAQCLALLLSRSRGPQLGLLFSAVLALALTARMRGWPLLRAAGAATLAAAVLGGALLLPASPLRPLADSLGLTRWTDLQGFAGETVRVRPLIWESATETIAADPLRTLVGYGPETMLAALQPHYSPEIAHLEHRGHLPDRAHNQLLDVVVGGGLLGGAAWLALLGGIFFLGFRGLGLADANRAGAFAGRIAAGVGLGIVAPVVVGAPRLAGLTATAGVCLSVLWLALHPVAEIPARRGDRTRTVLCIALIAAVGGSLVEGSVGIPTPATQLCFWLFAGSLVAITAMEPGERIGQARSSEPAFPSYVILFPTLLGVIAVYAAVLPEHDLNRTAPLAALLVVPASMLALASICRWSDRVAAVAIAAGVSLTFGSLLAGFTFPRPTLTGTPWIGGGSVWSHTATLLHVTLLLWALAATTALGRSHSSGLLRHPLRTFLCTVAVLPLSVLMITHASIAPNRADVLAKQASRRLDAGQPEAAIPMLRQAIAFFPHAAAHWNLLGRAHQERARREQDTTGFARAIEMFAHAESIYPYVGYQRSQARVLREWAAHTPHEPGRSARYEQARQAYEEARRMVPRAPDLLDEMALMAWDRRHVDEALALLDRSIAMGGHANSYWIRGNLRLKEQNDPEGALKDYESSIQADPWLLAAYSAKGAVLLSQGRLEEAVAVNEAARAIHPEDVITLENLAILYRDTGHLRLARQRAREALELAPQDRELRELLEELSPPSHP